MLLDEEGSPRRSPESGETGIKIHVPFKYDLGGRVKDVSGFRDTVMNLYGNVEADQAILRSWNLSYLACHAVVLRSRLAGGIAEIAGSEWSYKRSLRLYPWLGVLSVDYEFEPKDTDANILTFYDGLVKWKNADYLPYLENCGAATRDLKDQTKFISKKSAQDLHANIVLLLRFHAQPYISPRPALYAFHDFRVCFIDKGSKLDAHIVQCLLWLTTPEASDGLEDISGLKFRSIEILSTGWSTVLRTGKDVNSADVAMSVSLLNLVHAQWFICQSWINIYDPYFTEVHNGDTVVGVHELSACQLSLARDLSEVGNFEVMLKDPNLLRVARSLELSFSVLKHQRSAEQRLRILEDHFRNLSEFTRERNARRLATLFSLSAAGTVAALVPALVQIDFPLAFTIVTISLLIILWLGFTINFAVLLRGVSTSTRTRRKLENRGKFSGEQ